MLSVRCKSINQQSISIDRMDDKKKVTTCNVRKNVSEAIRYLSERNLANFILVSIFEVKKGATRSIFKADGDLGCLERFGIWRLWEVGPTQPLTIIGV